MVLLTITPLMVEGLKRIQGQRDGSVGDTTEHRESGESNESSESDENDEDGENDRSKDEPSLTSPAVANPISHRQVIELWQTLKKHDANARDTFSLEALLVGAKVYVPPPLPRPEPSTEYKALMARLRRDEEARIYQRMVSPPDPYASTAFSRVNQPIYTADADEDEITFSDVHRQVMVILNFVLTMGGVAYTLWVLARWWPTPSRLFLSMGGSVLVGVAEYGLYAGYIWHLSEAKKKDMKQKKSEVKQVVRTWVVGADAGATGDAGSEKTQDSKTELLAASAGTRASGRDDGSIRKRKQEPPAR